MRWVVFTNLFVAFCGATLTATSYALFGLPPRLDPAVWTVFFATLVVYNLDRLVEPHPGDSEHERWIEQHRGPLWWLTLASAIGAAASASQLPPAALYSLCLAGAVAIGYCLPLVPGKARWRRLKELPGVKLLLIAGVWAYATAGLPMLVAGVQIDLDAAGVLASRFFFLAAVALPFDLPDMERDRLSGIATLPTRFGVGATRATALVLAGLSMLGMFFVPTATAIALLISGAIACGLIGALRADRGVWYFMVMLDGMLLVQACMLGLSA